MGNKITGPCPYCGRTTHRNYPGNHGNTCKYCRNGLAWVLECVRYSDEIARHIARTEARESFARTERERQHTTVVDTDTPVQPDLPEPAAADPLFARLDRLEKGLTMLMTELGVK